MAIPVAWLVAAAAALALVTATRVYLSLSIKGFAEPAGRVIAGESLRWALWLPTVPLILALEARWGFARRRWPAATLAHAIGAAAVLLAHTAIMTVAGHAASWYFVLDDPRATLLVQLVHEGAASFLVYGAVVGAAHVRLHLQESERRRLAHAHLEARLARERLRNLQMQLHPHFLFNTLHAVAGLIREGDQRAAVGAVTDLGDLLRRSLDGVERQLVPLEEELDFVRAYLQLQKARHGSRLCVRIESDDDARRALVPHLILQPFVENAIQHGTSRREEGGTVVVRAAQAGNRLVLEVEDDGPGPPREGIVEGVGLRNTRERLAELYDDDFSFTLEHGAAGGAVARVSIPFHREAEPA